MAELYIKLCYQNLEKAKYMFSLLLTHLSTHKQQLKDTMLESWVLHALSTICVFFTPVFGVVLAVGAAIFLNTFTGILKTYKLKGWEHVSYKRLKEVVGRMVVYNICMLSVFAIDEWMLNEILKMWLSVDHLVTKFIGIFLVFIESFSIKENFEAAYNKSFLKLIREAMSGAKEIKDGYDDLKDKDGE